MSAHALLLTQFCRMFTESNITSHLSHITSTDIILITNKSVSLIVRCYGHVCLTRVVYSHMSNVLIMLVQDLLSMASCLLLLCQYWGVWLVTKIIFTRDTAKMPQDVLWGVLTSCQFFISKSSLLPIGFCYFGLFSKRFWPNQNR